MKVRKLNKWLRDALSDSKVVKFGAMEVLTPKQQTFILETTTVAKKKRPKRNSTKSIRLFALDFYEVMVDWAEGRINYHLIEIESQRSNC